jgi:hypothetical protein
MIPAWKTKEQCQTQATINKYYFTECRDGANTVQDG